MLSDAGRALISAPNFAHLAIVDSDGQPHVTPVWVDLDADDQVVINTAVGRIKDRFLPIGAKCAISVLDPDNPYRYLEAQCLVSDRSTADGDAVIDGLAHKYMGVDTYPFRQPGEQRVTIRLQITNTTGAAS